MDDVWTPPVPHWSRFPILRLENHFLGQPEAFCRMRDAILRLSRGNQEQRDEENANVTTELFSDALLDFHVSLPSSLGAGEWPSCTNTSGVTDLLGTSPYRKFSFGVDSFAIGNPSPEYFTSVGESDLHMS